MRRLRKFHASFGGGAGGNFLGYYILKSPA